MDLQKMPILTKKNHLFRWSSFWSWRIWKQAKLSHLGHRKPIHIHWKADATKASQRLNWVTRRGRYSQWRSLSGHVDWIFVHKNWRGGYWQHSFSTGRATCHTAEATLDVLRRVFEDGIISRKADVIWPPRSCDLMSLDYCLWGAFEDKCYADKPKTIDTLKDNIRKAIGEIQLHTNDNVL